VIREQRQPMNSVKSERGELTMPSEQSRVGYRVCVTSLSSLDVLVEQVFFSRTPDDQTELTIFFWDPLNELIFVVDLLEVGSVRSDDEAEESPCRVRDRPVAHVDEFAVAIHQLFFRSEIFSSEPSLHFALQHQIGVSEGALTR